MGVGVKVEEEQVLLEAEVGSLGRKPRKRSVKYLDGAQEERRDFTRPGKVQVLYETGDVYEGCVMTAGGDRGLARNGKGLYKWNGGRASYEGSYVRNVKNGHGRYVAPNGDIFEGEFENGLKSGPGVYTYVNGDKYVGSWLRGERHGKGSFVFANGTSLEVEFSHGTRVVASRSSATFTKKKHHPLGLVLAGGPATGKATQAQLLARILGVICVNPVELVERAAAGPKSKLERQVASAVDSNARVRDELLVRLVFQRLKQKDVRSQGFVLVDFPKTATQAQLLSNEGVVIDRFIHLSVSRADMEERVNGRRRDPQTGKIYHLAFRPPPPELLESVVPLSKDAKEHVSLRAAHHEAHVDAVKDHYNGKVLEVDASAHEKGVLEDIRHSLNQSDRPIGIIIAGAPGAGKGTQSQNIHKTHGLVHLSSGDLLRAEVKAGTDEGKAAKKFMDAGELVPVDLIVGIIKKRLQQDDVKKHGFLLDGFPRQLEEAEALLEMGVVIDLYLVLDVSEEKLKERVLGRLVDPETGHSYHAEYNPPPRRIRDRLKTRVDDTAEKFQRRVRTFEANIGSIKKFFGDRVHVVNGDVHIDRVSKQVEGAVQRTLRARIKEGSQ